MKIEIFEPDKLSSIAINRQKEDKNLAQINENIKILKSEFDDLQVERYEIKENSKEFMDNSIILQFLKQYGQKVLPITIMDDRIIKIGDYPSLEDIKSKLENK